MKKDDEFLRNTRYIMYDSVDTRLKMSRHAIYSGLFAINFPMGKSKSVIAMLSKDLSYGRCVRVEALRGEKRRKIRRELKESDAKATDETRFFIFLDDSRRRRWWRRSERLVRVWGLRFEVNAGGDVISR